MGEGRPELLALPAPIWWRWAAGLVAVDAIFPLLLTLLLQVAVAGANFHDRFGMAAPSVAATAAAMIVPLSLLFAVLYWRLRTTRDRPFLVKLGAVVWGVVGGMVSVFVNGDPEAAIVTFPLAALVGAAASYLFIVIADGRAAPAG